MPWPEFRRRCRARGRSSEHADGQRLALSGGGGIADNPTGGDLLLGTDTLITGISPDRGSSSNDGTTNATRIAFSGTGSLLSTISIYRVGTIGSADQKIGSILTVGTVWSFNYSTTLADGSYRFYVRGGAVLGLLGTSSPSTPFTVTIDTSAGRAGDHRHLVGHGRQCHGRSR